MNQIQVVNQALIILESDPITDIDQNSDSARTMKAIWDFSLRFVLRDNDFGFSRAYEDISKAVDAPKFVEQNRGEMDAFRLPDDLIRVRQVLVDNRYSDFHRRVGRYIYTRAETIGLFYIYEAPIGEWDDSATECLSYYLAHKAARAITQSNEVKSQALQDYQAARLSAKQASGLENSSEKVRSEGRLTLVRNQTGGRQFIN